MSSNYTQVAQELKTLVAKRNYDEAAQLVKTFIDKPLTAEQIEEIAGVMDSLFQEEDSKVLATLSITLGDILYRQNLYDRARAIYLKSLTAIKIDPIDRGKLFHSIANSYYMDGDYYSAKDYYLKGLETFRHEDYSSGIAESLIQLSDIARTLGQYSEAEEFGRSSLPLNVSLQRKKSVIRNTQSLCNLALQLDAMGEVSRAAELLKFILEQLQNTQNDEAVNIAQNALQNISK